MAIKLSTKDPKVAGIPIHIESHSQFQALGILVQHLPMIRYEGISSVEDVSALMSFVETISDDFFVHRPKRYLSMQLNVIENDWNAINAQHPLWLQWHANDGPSPLVAHLSLPTYPIYHNFSKPDRFTEKQIYKLLSQFNAEAWCIYCYWVSEEIEKIIPELQPEDSEEYQLQARLEDFIHEIHSPLLRNLLKNIRTTLLEVPSEDKSQFLIEKNLIQYREHLSNLLVTQCLLLKQITKGIEFIQEIHPELLRLKRIAELLQMLMASSLRIKDEEILSWGKQILMLQLLNQHLHVLPMFNCANGIERAQMVSVISMALAELSLQCNLNSICTLCERWPKSEPSMFLQEMRLRVLKNAEVLRNTLPEIEKRDLQSLSKNEDFFLFFPQTISLKFEGESQAVMLWRFDEKKDFISTETAERLFHRLRLV